MDSPDRPTGSKNLIIDLPAEIRVMIYEKCLKAKCCIALRAPAGPTRSATTREQKWNESPCGIRRAHEIANTPELTTLLRVNKFIYRDASPTLYHINRFVIRDSIRGYEETGSISLYGLQQFLQTIPSTHVACIRHICFVSYIMNIMWDDGEEVPRTGIEIPQLRGFSVVQKILAKHFTGLQTLVLNLSDDWCWPDDSGPTEDSWCYDRRYLLRGLKPLSKMKSLKQVTIYGRKVVLDVFPTDTKEIMGKRGIQIREVETDSWKEAVNCCGGSA
ncbi:uncharacterized protein PAC_12184 [Phialocephala subalpina]|uniref:DUF7730 domain-containing protein n=1 Tax=Phialocephala subalpina TaxID=576137 RepID=A0A1L7XBE1_9HELO|nr:uncharacterized protein PAC_12184 [Phialocephala subalpina]